MSLKMIVTKQTPRAEAVLHGTLDRDSARVLRLRTQSLMATGHRILVLDVGEVDVADEIGVQMLAYVRRIYRIAGGTLSMVGLAPDLEERLSWVEEQERRGLLAGASRILIR